jgi:multiple sugar transport system substrate-binding protein
MASTIDRRTFLKGAGATAAGLAASSALPLGTLGGVARAAASPTQKLPPGTISFWTYVDFPHQFNVLQSEVITPFERAHPGTKVNMTILPSFGTFTDKLSTAFATGNPPDVFVVSVAYAWDYAQIGLLGDLTPYLSHFNMNNYYTQLLAPLRYPNSKGHLYSWPYDWVDSVLYYNLDLFDEAGVAPPNDNWTYDDLLAAAQKLTNPAKNQYGFQVTTANTFLDALIVANGGSVLNSDYTKCTLGQPAAMKSLQWAVDLVHKYKVSAPPNQSPQASAIAAGNFATGKVAMQIDGSYGIETVKGAKFRWNIAMVPKGTHGRVVYGGPNAVGVAKRSKNPALAAAFALTYAGPSLPLDAVNLGTVPFYKPNAEKPAWLARGNPPNMKVILEEVPYIQGAEFGHNWLKWRDQTMNDVLAPSFNGNTPLSITVPQAVKQIDAILKQPF